MIAPSTLALHGNLAGSWGQWLPLGVCSAVFLHILILGVYKQWGCSRDSLAGEANVYRQQWGSISAHAIPLAGRLVAALAGATGMLVTAGFSFNETFLYWFPNFAFAYLLLGVVMAIHVFGQRLVQRFQGVVMIAALGGVVLLTAVALVGPAAESQIPLFPASTISIRSWAPLLLLFVGADLAFLGTTGEKHPTAKQNHWVLGNGLITGALIFSFWGMAAVKQVPLERLADTTIAPILVAKNAWGDSGRYIMGVVTIAGTLAAVNALFSMVAATINGILRKEIPTGSDRQKKPLVSTAAVVLVLGAATAVSMAIGLAGTDAVDVALKGGLLLWLLHHAMLALLLSIDGPLRSWPRMLAGSVMLAGIATLTLTDPDRVHLLGFMLAGLVISASVVGGIQRFKRMKRTKNL